MSRILEILYTLIVYSIAIVPSVLLAARAETNYRKQRTNRFVFLMTLALLPPCLLAAFRGVTVGNDVLVYAKPVYLLASKADSLLSLLRMQTRYEIGYLTLAYVASHGFHTFHAMLFLTQLLVLTPIFIGAHRLRNYAPAWSVVMCYLAFFYVSTFNIMREGIATSFIFLAFAEIQNKKYYRSALCAALGILFHSTAAIGIALILFILWFRNIKSTKTRAALLIIITLVVPICMSRWTQILTMLVNLGLIKARYLKYIDYLQDGTYLTDLYFVNYLELGVRWIGVLIPLLFYQKDNSENGRFQYSLLIGTLLGTMIYTSVFVALHSSYGYRVSFYLETLLVVWMSTLARERLSLEKFPLKTFVLLISVVACFLVLYVWRGVHGTLPFFFQTYDF